MADLDCCGPAEVARIARDVGISGADLSILAGKWPDLGDLLYWRMNEINLDRKEVTQADPQVMRDLQRVCTVCGSKRRCEHELAKNPSDPTWQKYCPNATTLSALTAERAAKTLPRARANKSIPACEPCISNTHEVIDGTPRRLVGHWLVARAIADEIGDSVEGYDAANSEEDVRFDHQRIGIAPRDSDAGL
jgi:hypothetical protein